MNGVLGYICAHIGYTGPGEPPKNGEVNEMTLPSRHMIQNSSPVGLSPSTLPLGHGGPHYIESLRVSGEETFYFFETRRPEQFSTFQAGNFNH